MAGRPARGARGPRARLGQHALGSRRLAAALVRDAGIAPSDLVLDLGAGAGILTAAIAAAAETTWAVELDRALADRLLARFGNDPGVVVVEADARDLAWPRRPFKVVANLPFAGATAILRALLDDPRVPLETADLVLQWEAASKLAAVWPGTVLTVYWGAWYELALRRRLAPAAFAPPPAVAAGVLRVERRASPLVGSGDAVAYRAFLRRGFARGAPLRRAVAPLLPARVLKRLAVEHGFDPSGRPRDLDARQWAALFGSVRRPS